MFRIVGFISVSNSLSAQNCILHAASQSLEIWVTDPLCLIRAHQHTCSKPVRVPLCYSLKAQSSSSVQHDSPAVASLLHLDHLTGNLPSRQAVYRIKENAMLLRHLHQILDEVMQTSCPMRCSPDNGMSGAAVGAMPQQCDVCKQQHDGGDMKAIKQNC